VELVPSGLWPVARITLPVATGMSRSQTVVGTPGWQELKTPLKVNGAIPIAFPRGSIF
jgi:hypothetical protein